MNIYQKNLDNMVQRDADQMESIQDGTKGREPDHRLGI